MKFSISKNLFLKGIQKVENITATKTTLPILSNVLLEASENEIKLITTNLEVSVKNTIPAQVQENGSITLPCKKLGDIIRELPEAKIEVGIEKENKVIIKCEKSIFNILGLPKEEFPNLPKLEDKFCFSIKQEILKNMIKKTKFAISNDEARYTLNGIYLIIDYTQIKMIATDGRRLAYIGINLPNLLKEKKDVIIPSKTINEINRVIEEGETKINLSENQISFQLNNTLLISRLIEGHFPNYEQVIPQKQEKKIKVNTKKFLQGVRRIALLADEKTNSIKIKTKDNRLIITASSPEIGEAQEEIEAVSEGKEIEIIFDARYILDILNNIDSEETALELTDSLSPATIRPVGEEDYFCIIMPMKL